MSYLIDTCCISELVKKQPDPNVVQWFSDHDELAMYLSVITFGELTKGIEKLPASNKKKELRIWIQDELLLRFENRILDISIEEINTWGKILADTENKGTPVPAVDALISATALVHDLIVVTRNVKDIKPTGAEIFNPWDYKY